MSIIYSQYNPNSTWIETALQDWTLSSTIFPVSAEQCIVGYDSDQEKVIIIGGSYSKDRNTLYIYDPIEDTLSSVPISWDSLRSLINYG